MSDLAERLGSLSPRKRELLLRRLLETPPSASADRIPAAPRQGDLPLSFGQQRLWFLDRLHPGSAAYNLPAAVRLSGRLDVAALREALREIVRRHEVLRTCFEVRAGRPVQVIVPAVDLPLAMVDLSGLESGRRESELRILAEEACLRSFDLRRVPLLRAMLARLEEGEHALLLTFHHIASDGWSFGVLVREMAVLYRAFSTGEPSPLPELLVQYADFAVWQREWLRGEILDRQLAWWRDRLAGAPVLQLATDRPRVALQSYRGAIRHVALDAGTSELLRELGRQHGATPFMTLLAGFEALLHRSTAQDDLIVGSTVANRTRRELEGLIGFFVNTLALRSDLSGDPSFDGLVDRVRETALGAFAHQDVPFEKLVAELQPERDLSRAPLFQVVCQFQNVPVEPVELPGLTMTPVVASVHEAKFDLVLNLWEERPVFKGELRYNTGLFEPATAERMVRHLEILLAGAVAEPFRRLSELPLLSEPERQQLVLEWNEAPAGGFEDGVLHELFTRQAARAPEATAVIDEEERLSYGELDARANRLARFLIGRGVSPGDRVALFLERGAGMVVALLATLKTGAAYVPLDPASPAERLALLVEDSRPQVLVTSNALAADLPETGRVTHLVLLDGDEEEIARESGAALAVPVSAEHPAYVIYTSGSTGRPKGVVVRHGNAVRLFTATGPWFGFGPDDVWSLFHSYAFDFSVWELWGALLHGGRVVVVPFWVSRSPEAFYDLLRRERVTVLNQTPSAFRQLIWAEGSVLAGAEPDLALRWVILGGEALEPASLAPWFDRHGDERPTVVNMYGITETTVHVTSRPVRRGDLVRGSVLGRPIPDLRVYVLDRCFQLQPIGIPGELHVGGAGLAQVYLDRPDLTAGRFVPDPFSAEPGARLYRSGDLARRLPDGDLEYLGRIDHQVKIRGFRVELGEIEAALASHPGVRESVVLAREEDGGTGRRLVAYVVQAPDEALDPADIRAFLARRLPDYMVPAAFVLLRELPLTGNGKIDRRALPLPEETGAARERVLPRTDLERFLAGQIRDVLGLPAEAGVGLHDDFFELGGNSISGAILIHRLQEALGEIVHVVTIFDHPTVASLAAYVKEQHPAAARRIWGEEEPEGEEARPAAAVGPAEVEEMRRLIILARPEPAPEPEEPLNLPALFVLSPPRSGSTLLRVMLGVHPGLFAPPELELLSFRTLAERSAAFQGRDAFWREGLVRALMEARGVSAAEAERILEDAELQGWTTRRFYRELQSWLGERMLVDKTPSYALDPEVLRRAEAGFAGARYLHLVRHPQAALRSFEEARLDQIFFRRPHPFSRRQLAELVWAVSHRNILDFLAGIPRERWLKVSFEDLVRKPDRVVREICGFLDIEHRPEMADPYRDGAARMVDGPHAVSRMLGDVKLLSHGRVDPAAAERWREAEEVPLGAPTRSVAEELGYLPAPERDVLVLLQTGSPDRPPLFCVHPVGGEVVAYRELAQRLPGQTVYGLRSPGRPIEDLREMAALYVEAVRQTWPGGPYRLAGWSMGGVVAFEMARQLGGCGQRVELLALIDTISPVLWRREPEPDEAGLVAAFAGDLARTSRKPVPDVVLSGLDGDGALALVLRLGKEAGLLAPGVELPELRRLFERFRANRRALSGYEPAPSSGEAVLFRARERPAGKDENPALGWRGLVATLSVREVPGDHYSILRDGVEALAGHLRDLMGLDAVAPASFAQRRLWFLDRFQPGSAAYNLPFAVRLAGRLDAAVLARAFTEIVRRHEPLRTTFREAGGEPVQVIAPPAPVPLPVLDLSALPPERRRTEALELAAEEAGRPFDLARGPLFRPLLLRLGASEHIASLTMHHIVTDGWSMRVLLMEVAALYPAFAAGLPSPLPGLPARFADFAARQRRWLEGPEPAALLAWWKERLAGAPVLELPTDRPRPEVRRGRGAMETFAILPEVVLRLREVARTRGATLYMGLLAVFQVLLHRSTRQDDLVIGSPVAGRDRPEVQSLIGFFINAVALRGRVDGLESFRVLLERTRDVCLEAWARQELPFERLVEEIQPERSLARSPVFQVVLSLEERPAPARLSGLEAEPLTIPTGASKFDLTLMLAEREGRIDGFAELDTDLFDSTTIRRFLGHFRNLIAAASADPDRPVAELPMLDEAERHQVAVEASARETSAGALLHELFAAQADRHPGAVAVSFAGDSVTYGELARRAAGLAHRLRGLGVGPEVPVALWCEREPGLIVAVLGVLAAGGAYVPLDPSWPEERVALVLEDSGVRLLVRGPGTPPPEVPPGVEVIELGEDAAEGFPASGAAPENTAYVIFTSGSTGRPKGVAVTHRNVARLLEAAQPWFGFGGRDVWTLFHSYAFDFSVWEMWGALAHGGRVVIVPWEVSRSPEALANLLEREGVTVLNQTPSAFQGLVDLDRRMTSLSWVIFGGEALDAGRLAPWWERHAPDRPRLVNMYGITETTVHVTFRPVGPGDAWSGAGSAIGRPLPDLSVHVLGPRLDPAPLGVPGEQAVGGAGVARGYLGRPDLTAERFVPDPFGGEAGARLYLSGDLGRLRPSGELEYLGRIDRQVKVRGFRIEPGEIEAALARHPAVAEAAVVVREDLPGGRGLVAFCVAPGLGRSQELRAFLKGRLPEPLVPAVFVLLDLLPLTPNGKVDRRALAARPLPAMEAGEPSTSPRTPAEELLAGIWTELLGRERVGVEDDFFALGGHSLLATQLVSRVRETFGVELPLRAVFQAPTLAALAAAIPREGGMDAAPPIVPVPRDGDLPLSFAQRRLWFIDRLVPGNPFYVMAFGLRLEGPLHVEALRAALREVGRRHESLRTTFHSEVEEPRQVVAERVDLKLPVVDLSGLGPALEGELRALGREEARRPFDLQRGPLLRGFLARLGGEDHALLLQLHHVIADGWSMGVLRRELSVLYEAFAEGLPSPLPELPVQYADFAVWQRRWLAGEALERQLDFWRRQLAGAPPVLDLPFDHPRPAVETFRGSVSGFALPDGLVRRLRTLGRGLGTTLSMTALAAFDLLLARYARREDVVVGSAVANRNRREIEDLIGFFVNVLVLRTSVSGNPSFAGLAGRVRETSLAAFAHQDLPFEKLVEELQLPRDLAHHPLCQVMYGFQNFPRHDTRVRDLNFPPLEGEVTETGTAKADLTLFLAEDGDGLRGWIEFNADLFEPVTILRLGRHLSALLEAAAEAPETPVGALSMLLPGERHQLVREWSSCGPEPEPEPLLPARIATRVREAPDAPALVSADGALSYGELHRRAGRLAGRLREAGAGPEVRVGICLDRPDAMVEAVLGVTFAGGAWVPLDPAYPAARLAFMLADSGCDLLLTTEELLPRLPVKDLPRMIWREEAGGEGEAPPVPEVLPQNLAYVIYTSGSTGRPKGVAVTHGSLARVTGALVRTYGVGPGDRVLQMMSPSFDVFVSEVANALGSGAALHVASRDERLPGPPLAALLREQRITVLGTTPSVLAALEPADVPALRTVMLGGETCPAELAARWAPGRRLFTAYGPTEATITCTTGRIGAGDRPDLGWPLEGVRIHLLDGHLEPVPAGVPGEIFIAGEGLARGYHGRPDLTAERFVPNPFGPPGSRLYRSGDLARRKASGRLEFLGRLDDQVKLRGYRIEPGEVEARLAAHPEVESAVVLARNDSLVAWVVPKRAARGEGLEEQVEDWRRLYEETYARERGAEDPDADLVGWNSSFTGEPILAAEMREWVDVTVEEILELRPRRVLEIGCGTGLLLRRVAPQCSLYVGTDFSRAALDGLERRLAGSLPQVRLEHRMADDFEGVPDRSFDAVVLNSVAQYFPGVDYLVEVLEKAVGAVADGGAVFLGDVRSLALAEDFYLAVEMSKANPSTSPEELRRRAAARRLQESELLVHPDLFHALRRRLARVRGVEVRPKRGKADNELTRYRFQVVLHVGEDVEVPPSLEIAEDGPWSRWANDPLLGRLSRRLVPELRAWAQESLPELLVPSAIVVLDTLPRTLTGKVDRRALPAPELAAPSGGETTPRTPLEAEVAAVFRALLGRERLGVETDFFQAGGHSLLATQAVSRLRDRLGVELPLRDLFETPTVAGLARRIEALARSRTLEAPPILPVPHEEPPPLSFAQERLWFLDQLDTGRSPYSLSTAVRFEGTLDLEALEASLDEVVRRHEALRTTFVIAGGRPVQKIAASLRIGMPVLDLAGLPEETREAELARWIDEESRWPFDLATGPLVRALAFRLGPEDHAVVLTLHHIVSDGWSMGVLIRELGTVYAKRLPLPEPPVQYADFAVWQRDWLQGEVLERQLGYWRQRLAGGPPVLSLPLDRPRPLVHTFHGRYRRGELTAAAVEALSALGSGAGATLFMTLLAAWNALLFRVTGEPDVLVGTPVANRNRAEIEGLIGFFVNTLVLRADLSGNPGFLALLEQVREAALGAYSHQDLPFERLVEELAPERSLRHSPVFQVMFAFEEDPPQPPDLPGLRLKPLAAESRTVKFDLTLLARRLGDGLQLALGYNSDLFHATTAERLLGHLQILIEGAVADPCRPVAELPLLSAAQQHQLLLGWNDTAAAVPPLPLHRLFEEWAARQPERTSLVAPDETLTYAELDRWANRLARRLLREGVGPEIRVGLLLDRSPRLVTSILAILKAGGAWVPFDPGLPSERLTFLLADSGVALILTEERLARHLSSSVPALFPEAEGEDDSRPAVDVSPDQLAYVIYTSGSTGVPKGVAVTHRGLASLARAQADLFGLGAADRVLQFSSPSFDASVWEMLLAWNAGAELHLAPREALLPGASLADLLCERAITSVLLPPTALSVTPQVGFPSLRSLVVGGEPCPPELAERWSAGRPVTNAYGPTEATVCATAGHYEPGNLRMTVGRPLANARVLLLDPQGMEPVAHGVAGEVCLAGPGLARGYLGRPDLTAERFVPDPWDLEPGARLYRTGDLGRWLGDGRIELLGRIDEQVKVRGFRVEPGEVRAALLTHPAVREAEVMAPAGPGGERRLVAWVAADLEAAFAALELRRFLETRLPDWLVPSRIVLLDALPRTASGKVDRRALPSADESVWPGAGTPGGPGRREPANELERLLLEAWQEVLGLRSIGVEDNFFDLGGTSLQGAILTNLLQERLGEPVYPVALFDAPTIAELARYLERQRPAGAERHFSSLVPLRAGGSEPPLFLVHPLGGDAHCYLGLASLLEDGRPVYGLQGLGLRPGEEPHETVEEMAAWYLEEVRRVAPRGPYHLGGWSLGGVIAFEMAQRLARDGERVDLLALLDPMAPGAFPRTYDDTDILWGLAWELGNLAGRKLEVTDEELRGLAGEEGVVHLLRRADEAGALPAGFGVDQAVRLWRLMSANVRAIQSYRPEPYPGRALLFVARESKREGIGPDLGWGRIVLGGVDMVTLDARHAIVLRGTSLETIADRLRRSTVSAREKVPVAQVP